MDPYLNHEYEENPERPGTVKRFFFACAGAYLRILEATPSEHAKYVGIGATIFLTGCMAVISGTFALYTLVPNLLVAIPGGLLWGALIFNLDRYIVSSIRKEGRFWYEFGLALPRLGLAVLISFDHQAHRGGAVHQSDRFGAFCLCDRAGKRSCPRPRSQVGLG